MNPSWNSDFSTFVWLRFNGYATNVKVQEKNGRYIIVGTNAKPPREYEGSYATEEEARAVALADWKLNPGLLRDWDTDEYFDMKGNPL